MSTLCGDIWSTKDVMETYQPLPGGARSLMGDKHLGCIWTDATTILDIEFEVTEESDDADGDN